MSIIEQQSKDSYQLFDLHSDSWHSDDSHPYQMGSLPCLVDWRWHYAYDHYLFHYIYHFHDYHDEYGDRRRQHAALLQTWQPPLGHQDSGKIEDVQKRNFIRPKSNRCLALLVIESLTTVVEFRSRF